MKKMTMGREKLEGKAVSRKRFVDSEDELSFLEGDKENEESGK